MARGSKPGERRGGRQAGTPNKATLEIKDIARAYGPAALELAATLAGLVNEGKGKAESEQARIAALNIVLDRGYGKAPQTIAGDPESPLELRSKIEMTIIDPKSRGS